MYTEKIMLIPDYIDEIDKLKQENQSLKKQLEELNKKLYLCTPEIPKNNPFDNQKYRNTGYMEGVEATDIKYKRQQKEFIDYLENEINRFKDLCLNEIITLYEDVLSKYKSIIGEKNE